MTAVETAANGYGHATRTICRAMFGNQRQHGGRRSGVRQTFEDFENEIAAWDEPRNADERVQGNFQVTRDISAIITIYPDDERAVVALEHNTNDETALRSISTKVERTLLLGSGALDWTMEEARWGVEYVGEGTCTRYS